jgi:hypothetical protein
MGKKGSEGQRKTLGDEQEAWNGEGAEGARMKGWEPRETTTEPVSCRSKRVERAGGCRALGP